MIEKQALSLSAKAGRWAMLACAALLTLTVPLHATTPEEQAVIAPFQKVLDAIGQHNPALARENLLPGGMATLMHNGQVVQMHFDTFTEHLNSVSTRKAEEKIYDPLVKIDNDIAVIWARYDFFLDGKVDHCGVDIAHLVKKEGKWLVAGIADNGRKDCPAK